MGKSTHFFGQPVYGQLIKSLDHDKIVEISRRNGGERYVKTFDGFTHLLTMLYAVIMRFDSLREIEAAMTAEVRKLHHIGIDRVPVVSLKVCNSSFLSLYFHCYFILFFPVFELIYSPFICCLCFLHRHGCQEEDDRLL